MGFPDLARIGRFLARKYSVRVIIIIVVMNAIDFVV